MKKAYIVSPLRDRNAAKKESNRKACLWYMERASDTYGLECKALHGLLPLIMDDEDEAERKLVLRWGKELLSYCDIILVCGSKITEGMKEEIVEAVKLNKPVWVFHEVVYKMLKHIYPDYQLRYINNAELALDHSY